jgi:hypothetical protein
MTEKDMGPKIQVKKGWFNGRLVDIVVSAGGTDETIVPAKEVLLFGGKSNESAMRVFDLQKVQATRAGDPENGFQPVRLKLDSGPEELWFMPLPSA